MKRRISDAHRLPQARAHARYAGLDRIAVGRFHHHREELGAQLADIPARGSGARPLRPPAASAGSPRSAPGRRSSSRPPSRYRRRRPDAEARAPPASPEWPPATRCRGSGAGIRAGRTAAGRARRKASAPRREACRREANHAQRPIGSLRDRAQLIPNIRDSNRVSTVLRCAMQRRTACLMQGDELRPDRFQPHADRVGRGPSALHGSTADVPQ